MTTTKSVIAVSNSTNSNSPGITITLESTGIFLGILVSFSILGGLGIKIVSSINRISTSIIQIEEDLKEYASNAEKIRELDKRFDLHVQEYINRKDVIQMLLGQMNEKIDHKFKRVLFYTRDIQRFLQRDTNFQIREYEENTEQE
ncbi:hypothetical protein [Halotia branconii]|uniref:Uncharacterized protein n=1 Tax=Halotia branconii CENA392 TaxID=1539056 RepID=A0AAJ6P9H2_9CYAN|nr:hypothetical protein [Halotia branconii]WGV23475.1 hypothetical protein QI031_16755 [Halotia branconii CENA392]WGV25666.1 hypothetical protein QI031_28765 [Halotia branconii CENA392]WGV25924.1 hypothetical protein QI031_30170 [Halotia branconii CENA392]